MDDGFAFHPKAIMAGNAALGLWVRAGAWCGANLTDGALPKHMIGTFGAQKRDARKLVEVGLWVETETGYQFHEWAQMQPSKAEVLEERAKNAKRQKAWRERQRNAVTDDVTNDVSDDVTNGAPTRPDPLIKEEPKEADASFGEARKRATPAKRGTRIAENFMPTPELIQWARTEMPNVDLRIETEKFINHWISKAGKDATKLDWQRTWKNWIMNSRGGPTANFPTRQTHSERTDAKAAEMLAKIAAHNHPTQLELGA